MLSQAPTDVVDALANYEMNLGMAFQLTNDILDVSTKMDSFQDHPVTRILEAATYMLPIIFTLHDTTQAKGLLTFAPVGTSY